MCIATENVNQARLGEVPHAGRCLGAEKEVGGRLDQRTLSDERRNSLIHIG